MSQMRQQIESAVADIARRLYAFEGSVELNRPDGQFGDFATNIALQLAKPAGKNPREVAEAIAAELRKALADDVSEVSIAGPGFINVRLSDVALVRSVATARAKAAASSEAVIETNNPNPFKAMHIGHAFNAILADSIANLLEAGQSITHRVSYHGDVGAHVGKSMWSLLKFVDGDATKLATVPEVERNSFMSRMYAEGAAAYKSNETARQEIDELARQSFTRQDPLYRQVYEICFSWSFEQIDRAVARLGNKPVERRYLESQADALGVETVRAHVPDVFVESDGALVFHGSQYGSFDNVFVGSNGRGLYAARDLGLMQLKNRDYPAATKSYIVTAEEQCDYFKGVIKAAELCLPQLTGVTVNISTGTVKLSTGKMSSRNGDVLEISWLFDQVAEAMRARGSEPDDSLIAGALRYQFLKVRIGSDVVFDVEESVSLQGNSGPYLQYAHARARSILAKAGGEAADFAADVSFEADERTLLRKISEYSETVDKAVAELMPHHICTYLYELAQTFNRFYEKNLVVGDPRQAIRLKLVEQYASTLKSGLGLLGITAPDRM